MRWDKNRMMDADIPATFFIENASGLNRSEKIFGLKAAGAGLSSPPGGFPFMAMG
jgi:hypothetical protein